MSDVRVLIVDDQPLLRHSLRIIVDAEDGLETVAEAGDGEAAVEAARAHRPDVVLMDVRMPGIDGIEATRRIVSDDSTSSCHVVVLTMFELDEYVHAALRAGASGFLLKDAKPQQLTDAVRRVAAGESLFAPAILRRLVAHYVDRPAPLGPREDDLLTPREQEVLGLIGRGLSNDEICRALVISRGTVKSHVGRLLAKLHARDRAQLVIAAYERGLAD